MILVVVVVVFVVIIIVGQNWVNKGYIVIVIFYCFSLVVVLDPETEL